MIFNSYVPDFSFTHLKLYAYIFRNIFLPPPEPISTLGILLDSFSVPRGGRFTNKSNSVKDLKTQIILN